MKLADRLVDDWRHFTRWWSVRMTLIGGLIFGLLTSLPAMPAEVQAAIPVEYRVIAVAIWSIASVVARLIQQKPIGG